MKQILPYFRSFAAGIITIPVNFLLKLLTRKTDGPLGATAVISLVLLFANFAMIIIMLFFYKNLKFLTWWAQSVALLNILTTQYIILLPCGALLFQVWSWVRHGWHIDSRVLLFLTLIFPIGGGIALGLGFSILGGLRYTTMPENNITIPALSLMRELHGAPWFSWGYFKDIMRTLFPYAVSSGHLASALFRIYFLIASLWFSFDVWRSYYGEESGDHKNSRLKAGDYLFDWKGISMWKKTASIMLASVLAAVSSALLYSSTHSFYHHYKISAAGIDTVAVADWSNYNSSKDSRYSIRYTFSFNNTAYEGTQYVDYLFHQYAKKKLNMIPVRFLPDNPLKNRIEYSSIYNIDKDFNNSYGVNLIVFLIGIGFLSGALYAFPGMAVRMRE